MSLPGLSWLQRTKARQKDTARPALNPTTAVRHMQAWMALGGRCLLYSPCQYCDAHPAEAFLQLQPADSRSCLAGCHRVRSGPTNSTILLLPSLCQQLRGVVTGRGSRSLAALPALPTLRPPILFIQSPSPAQPSPARRSLAYTSKHFTPSPPPPPFLRLLRVSLQLSLLLPRRGTVVLVNRQAFLCMRRRPSGERPNQLCRKGEGRDESLWVSRHNLPQLLSFCCSDSGDRQRHGTAKRPILPPTHPPTDPSIHPSLTPPLPPSIRLSVRPSVRPSVRTFTHPFIHPCP